MSTTPLYHSSASISGILSMTMPTIFMSLIQASYSMIDGIFISNLLGEQALSALTLISPYFNLLVAAGAMLASGGSAIIMKALGEGHAQRAQQHFSLLMLTSALIGAIFSTCFLLFTQPLVSILGPQPSVRELCREYLWTYSFFIIPQILFAGLQIYTIGCGNSKRAMISALAGGIVNILLDFFMIQILQLGMPGAAAASGLGMAVPCIILIIPFFSRSSALHFSKPRFSFSVLVKTASNGISEFASNFISGIVILLFNTVMLQLAGTNGIAASTITFYVFSFMSALYMGYMLGISPLLSYFYGAAQHAQMQKIRRISLLLISVLSINTALLSICGSELLVSAFTRSDSEAFALAVFGNRLFSLALLFVGFNTFASMLFTALSDGRRSAVIAFSRTFVFLTGFILVLSALFGLNGLWLAVPASEFFCFLLSFCLLKRNQPRYGY